MAETERNAAKYETENFSPIRNVHPNVKHFQWRKLVGRAEKSDLFTPTEQGSSLENWTRQVTPPAKRLDTAARSIFYETNDEKT